MCAREKPAAVIYDQEFEDLIGSAGVECTRILGWVDEPSSDLATLDGLIKDGGARPRTPPGRPARCVILTSGTTGTPKGAPRGPGNIDAAVALLSRIPLRAGWRSHVAAPMFHTWGWAHLNLAMLLGSTVVLTRRFDPESFLTAIAEHRCESAAVIPVMLQRTMALPPETLDRFDLSHVQVIAASGSALPGALATEWMDRFGDHVYNIYGSTEVAWVSIAQPADMRAAQGTAGKPPVNTVVRLYDPEGRPVREGEPGRIFVGNSMLFEGYTGGGHKEAIEGLLSTGDVGRFDAEGRLFVEGRDDEMIVSGGENVFPKEVEDLLAQHPLVNEAAAIGVSDPEFGHRLRAFVVLTTDGAIDEAGLKDHVKQNLARYKVPREIMFLPELPRNATGKVLKRDLAHYDD